MTQVTPSRWADVEPMQKRLIFEWIDELRSGTWTQIDGELENATGNCCLGVACRVYERAGLPIVIRENGKGAKGFSTDGPDGEMFGELPWKVRESFGLTSADGKFARGTGRYATLVGMNDEGMPFVQIANLIMCSPSLFENGEEVAAWLKEYATTIA